MLIAYHIYNAFDKTNFWKKKQIIEGSVQKPGAFLAKIYPCYI